MLVDDTGIQFAGGAELQQVMIARGLVKRGYSVSMICMDFGQDNEIVIDGITVHRALKPKSGIPVLRFIWPRLTSIWRCMKRANADIYCHRSASMLTGVMAFFCRLHGRKSVFAVAGENKIRISRDRWLFEYGIRRVDRIVVQNRAQQQEIEAELGRRSFLIPNCYETIASRESSSHQNILWVGTIRQVKRPELFLRLAEALPAFSFTMIGGPSEQERRLFSEMKAKAETLANVTFSGFVPYSEVAQYFVNATVFVNTSDREGFPNTFLQAWGCGVPTVSFVDSGAQIDGKPIGHVVDSIEEMIKITEELLLNESIRIRHGAICREYVEANHAPDVVLNLYAELFDSMRENPGEK
jgi:glycosyltransferase involved in cell wall biosynthesis